MTGGSEGETPPPNQGTEEIQRCVPSETVLYVLALVLLVFGFYYLLEPGPSVTSINSIASTLGLHLPPGPGTPPDFEGWLGFTFAYMIGATFCAFQAARTRTTDRFAYLNVLLLLKGTSSLTGIVFFLGEREYPFYLATFLIDGLLFAIILALRTHLWRSHRPPGKGASGDPAA